MNAGASDTRTECGQAGGSRQAGELAVQVSGHDTRARASAILALKQWLYRELTPALRRHFDVVVAPTLAAAAGRRLDRMNRGDRRLAIEALRRQKLYPLWAALSYQAQGMKWRLVEQAVAEDLPRLQAVADRYTSCSDKKGSLSLNPELPLPANIATTEIHRQPGGFCFETSNRDISAGVRYNFGASLGPAAGKGRSAFERGRSAGDFVCETVRARYPDLNPSRILEMGCGTGRNTPSYKRQFPAAEVAAVDCAAGLLRWAHVCAESQATPLRFVQMDITRMDFADASFDLVTSHIVGHETSAAGLRAMLSEAWRVLKPGGVMFHADVAIQPERLSLCDQALNDFQVHYNGEPFWMGWADTDILGLLRAIGVPRATLFADYLAPPERGGQWYCYGARKPAATP